MKKLLLLGIVFLMFTSVVSASTLSTGITGFFNFTNGLNNSVPGGAHGADGGTNPLKISTTCVAGGCVQFDGSSDYFQVDSLARDDDEAGTIAFWINTTAPGGNVWAFSQTNSGDGDILDGFQSPAANRIDYRIRKTGGVDMYNWAPNDVNSVNQNNKSFTFMAMSRNGAGKISWWLGSSSVTINDTYSTANNGVNKLTMMAIDLGGLSSYTIGQLDEFGIWSRELSSQEIEELYSHGLNGTTYPFNVSTPAAPGTAGITITSNATSNTNATNNPYYFTLSAVGNVVATEDNWTVQIFLNYTLNQTITEVLNLNTTAYILNLTYGAQEVGYDVIINVSHSVDAANDTFSITNLFLDSVLPNAVTNVVNNSVFYVSRDNITITHTGTDNNLFAGNFTIYKINPDGSINLTVNNTLVQPITGTSYKFNWSGRPQDLTVGRFENRISWWDSHTKQKDIKNLSWYFQDNNLVADSFTFEGDIKELTGGGDPATYFYLDEENPDRYKLKITFENDAQIHHLNISTSNNLAYIPGHGYLGHFVHLPSGRWVDFEGGLVTDVDVTQLSENKYGLTVYLSEVTDEIEFNSIGDLNSYTASYFFNVTEGYTFYAQDAINSAVLSNFTVSVYNGSTLVQTQQTLGQNLTFNITFGNFTTNISAAGYTPNKTTALTFTSGGSFTYNLFAVNSLYLFFYDETTNNLITDNVSIELIGPSTSNNYTTTTGSIFISGFNTGDYEINYNGLGWQQNAYFTTIATSTTQQLDLYLVDNSTSELIVFSILNEKSSPVFNGTLKRQRFIVDKNAWVLVGMSKTDTNGETGMYLVPNDVFYKFIVENSQSTTIFSGSQQQIYSTTVFLRVETLENILDSLTAIRDNLAVNLSYNNNTNIVSFTWNEGTGLVIRGCLDVLERNAFTETVVGLTCTDSNTGTVQLNLSAILKNNTQYLARAYVDTNTTSSQYHVAFIEIVANEPWKRFGNAGLFLSYIFIGTMFFLGLPVNFSIALVYSIVSMIVVQLLGVSFFSQGAIIIIGVIGFIIAMVNKT